MTPDSPERNPGWSPRGESDEETAAPSGFPVPDRRTAVPAPSVGSSDRRSAHPAPWLFGAPPSDEEPAPTRPSQSGTGGLDPYLAMHAEDDPHLSAEPLVSPQRSSAPVPPPLPPLPPFPVATPPPDTLGIPAAAAVDSSLSPGRYPVTPSAAGNAPSAGAPQPWWLTPSLHGEELPQVHARDAATGQAHGADTAPEMRAERVDPPEYGRAPEPLGVHAEPAVSEYGPHPVTPAAAEPADSSFAAAPMPPSPYRDAPAAAEPGAPSHDAVESAWSRAPDYDLWDTPSSPAATRSPSGGSAPAVGEPPGAPEHSARGPNGGAWDAAQDAGPAAVAAEHEHSAITAFDPVQAEALRHEPAEVQRPKRAGVEEPVSPPPTEFSRAWEMSTARALPDPFDPPTVMDVPEWMRQPGVTSGAPQAGDESPALDAAATEIDQPPTRAAEVTAGSPKSEGAAVPDSAPAPTMPSEDDRRSPGIAWASHVPNPADAHGGPEASAHVPVAAAAPGPVLAFHHAGDPHGPAAAIGGPEPEDAARAERDRAPADLMADPETEMGPPLSHRLADHSAATAAADTGTEMGPPLSRSLRDHTDSDFAADPETEMGPPVSSVSRHDAGAAPIDDPETEMAPAAKSSTGGPEPLGETSASLAPVPPLPPDLPAPSSAAVLADVLPPPPALPPLEDKPIVPGPPTLIDAAVTAPPEDRPAPDRSPAVGQVTESDLERMAEPQPARPADGTDTDHDRAAEMRAAGTAGEPEISPEENEQDRIVAQGPPRPGTRPEDVAWLAVLKGPSARGRQIFWLEAARTEIGRKFDSPIFVDDKSVS